MNHLPLIIKREYLTKVRNKSFVVMTFVSPLIFIALIAVVSYLSQLNNDKKRTIAILDESGILKSTFENTQNTSYRFLNEINLQEAITSVKEEEEYGLLYIPSEPDFELMAKNIKFYSEESPSIGVISGIENKLERRLNELQLLENGLDISMIEDARTSVDIGQESFDGKKSSKIDNIMKLAFGGAAGYLLFMFIIIYGNMIMRSVIEEKTSRIIEVIISSVKPVQLMMGKIIGTSLAGISQFIIWVILGGILLVVVSAIFGIDVGAMNTPQQELMQSAMENEGAQAMAESILNSIASLPMTNLVIAFLFFFVGGYFCLLYTSPSPRDA